MAKNRRSEEKEKINELENLLTTISVHINDTDKGSETSITQSDAAEENVTTEEIPASSENVTTAIEDGPNSLGLTSDSHVKRGVLLQLPQDDGNHSKDII